MNPRRSSPHRQMNMVLPTHSSFPPLSYSYLESDTSMPFEKLRENTLPVADTQDSRGQKTILNLMSKWGLHQVNWDNISSYDPWKLISTESLHLSSEYSDLKIICKDKIFPAHKLLVCPRSKYFHRACFAGFKVKPNMSNSLHWDWQAAMDVRKPKGRFVWTTKARSWSRRCWNFCTRAITPSDTVRLKRWPHRPMTMKGQEWIQTTQETR